MPTATRIECRLQRLGRLAYAPAFALQQQLAAARVRDEISDQLLLLEHPHVITKGSGSHDEHILADAARRAELGIELHESTRGGDVTYHGPGQLVGYPILKLEGERRDAHRYLRELEEVVIGVLAAYGLRGERHPDYTGVWVGDRKLCAIGVRLGKWVTSHGFALNVQPDLGYFDHIVPCGIRGRRVGSLAQELGHELPLREVEDHVVENFARVFGRTITEDD